MAEIRNIKCDCGHEASASYREKDSAYSSYGIWSFSNLDCSSNTVEKPVSMSLLSAISEAGPHCPKCSAKIETRHFD